MSRSAQWVQSDEVVPPSRAFVLECTLAVQAAEKKNRPIVVFVDRDPIRVPGCVVVRSVVRGNWKSGQVVIAFREGAGQWIEVPLTNCTDGVVWYMTWKILDENAADVPGDLYHDLWKGF